MKRFNRRLTSVVLAHLGLSGSGRYRIEYVDGFAPPKVVRGAKSYRWETRGGRPIQHPLAYSRVGWSSMTYVHAERGLIQVGAGWAIEHAV